MLGVHRRGRHDQTHDRSSERRMDPRLQHRQPEPGQAHHQGCCHEQRDEGDPFVVEDRQHGDRADVVPDREGQQEDPELVGHLGPKRARTPITNAVSVEIGIAHPAAAGPWCWKAT